MIERAFVAEKTTELEIHEYIKRNIKGVGHSATKIQRTPLGEKIIIYASRPGLIVGRKGQNIKKLTLTLKKKFNLENPQIEIAEVGNTDLDANIVAEKIANSLERFGTGRFKGVGHKMMENIMNSGALGAEIIISGKIPSARAKKWRFYAGYLKKCGEISLVGVKKGETAAQLKTGTVGIKVRIMPADTVLPDRIKIVTQDMLSKLEELPTDGASDEDNKKDKSHKDDKSKDKKKKPRKAPKKKDAASEIAPTEVAASSAENVAEE